MWLGVVWRGLAGDGPSLVWYDMVYYGMVEVSRVKLESYTSLEENSNLSLKKKLVRRTFKMLLKHYYLSR